MGYFSVIHDLVYRYVPSYQIHVGPAEMLVAIGGTGLVLFEIKLWKKHR